MPKRPGESAIVSIPPQSGGGGEHSWQRFEVKVECEDDLGT